MVITHDLDEAIKVADRIAIMEAGRVVQVGTAQDLVLRPANHYVARFTAKIAPAKVVRAEALVLENSNIPADAEAIAADAVVETFAPIIVGSDRVFAVRTQEGRVLGSLDVQAELRVLAGLKA